MVLPLPVSPTTTMADNAEWMLFMSLSLHPWMGSSGGTTLSRDPLSRSAPSRSLRRASPFSLPPSLSLSLSLLSPRRSSRSLSLLSPSLPLPRSLSPPLSLSMSLSLSLSLPLSLPSPPSLPRSLRLSRSAPSPPSLALLLRCPSAGCLAS